MSKSTLSKAALVALLVGAALAGQGDDGSVAAPDTRLLLHVLGGRLGSYAHIVGLLLFGIFNVLFSAPGTVWVRAAAVAATGAALLWPGEIFTLVSFFAWLVWPPAFLMSWGLARHPAVDRGAGELEIQSAATRARIALAALIAAVALASLAYRWLVAQGLQQTAALFVGIPALLAIVVVFAVSPRSATGVACKAVTVGLLVSLLFLGEGVLCVLMSAPLFFALAVAVAAVVDRARHRKKRTATTLSSAVVILAMLPLGLEGVTELTTLSRDESVAESKVVGAPAQAVERALFEAPRFDRVRPLYLRAGFPSPVATRIERGSGVMRWVIQMRGGEMRLDGIEPRSGDLVLELAEARPGFVRWRAVSDSSHLTHFLTWREASVRWEPVDADTTRVTWTLHYRRGLDPSWYFGPLERYAARLAAGYLIEAVATP